MCESPMCGDMGRNFNWAREKMADIGGILQELSWYQNTELDAVVGRLHKNEGKKP